MDKRICLITGSNSGIGKAAAIQLARSGFQVLLGCRSEERGKAALDEVRAKGGADAQLLIVDMSSRESIKKAAERFLASHGRLDALIHNAAEFDISRKAPALSPEGVETIWATNHLGPVLLTELLMEALKTSPQGRVLTVSSKGLVMHPFLKVDLRDPEFKRRAFSVEKAYYQSKLAQVMYAYYLADSLKGSSVTANCVRVTAVKVDMDRFPGVSETMKRLYAMKSRFALSPERMAEAYVGLAASPEFAKSTGKCYDENLKELSPSGYARNIANARALMKLTREYLR